MCLTTRMSIPSSLFFRLFMVCFSFLWLMVLLPDSTKRRPRFAASIVPPGGFTPRPGFDFRLLAKAPDLRLGHRGSRRRLARFPPLGGPQRTNPVAHDDEGEITGRTVRTADTQKEIFDGTTKVPSSSKRGNKVCEFQRKCAAL